jgi:hypothetical protein
MFKISRPKLGGLASHVGVQLPDGRVVHLSPERGVAITTHEEFAAGQDVAIIREVPAHLHAEVMRRLRYALSHQRSYVLGKWDCEIFANWLVGEKLENTQLQGWVTIGAIGLLAAASRW